MKDKVHERARQLLESSDFFIQLLRTMRKSGLIGERRNALAIYLAATSRLLRRPVNLLVKGPSGTGKNHLTDTVLALLPPECVLTFTSLSDHALEYGGNLQHKVLYLKERNDASGKPHQARLLISEGVLRRKVATGRGNSKVYTAHGPIACISTTTKNQIEVDDETRHLSIWVDDSSAQTTRILEAAFENRVGLSEIQLKIWQTAQIIIEERAAKAKIEIPPKYKFIVREVMDRAESTGRDTNRLRRYFGAFSELCKTITLIRSFQREQTDLSELEVRFSDLAIAILIFDRLIADSLRRPSEQARDTLRMVMHVSRSKDGKAVQASDIARAYELTENQAYTRLRRAFQLGIIRLAGPPVRTNSKFYLPVTSSRLFPDLDEIFQQIPDGPRHVAFIHPLKGVLCEFSRE